MEISYWQSRWRKNNIGWHMEQVYPPLRDLWTRLSLPTNARVLVPLCGKSLDLLWLADRGHNVIGIEVSKKALDYVRNQHPARFTRNSSHGFAIYRSDSMELWEGDFLKLPVDKIPVPDVIYDKAALVALPSQMRTSYGEKICALSSKNTQILLQTFEYNQDEMNGPPFSVDEEEVRQHFGQQFEIDLVHEQSKFDELSKFQRRGLSSYLDEKVYHLKPLHRA